MFRLTAFLLLCVPLIAFADPKSAAKRVAPLVNDQTFVFVRVDLKNAELEPFLKLLAPVFPDAQQHKQMVSEATQIQEVYLDQKCDELVILYGMEDAGEEPVLIAPTSFVRNLPPKFSLDFPESQVVGGNRLLGRKRSIDRYMNRKPSPRADLSAAVAGFGDGVIQVVLFPGKDARRTVSEISPQLPRELGGGPVNAITNGFSWASIEIGGKSPYPMKVTIQCTNDAAATKLLDVIQKGMGLGKGLELGRDGEPLAAAFAQAYPKLVEWVTPKRTGSRLVIEQDLEPRIVELSKMMPKPDPASTHRRFTQNNMKQIGLALHNYVDVMGRFPSNIVDAKGKPILSWRVELLPYIEQNVLYQQIDRKLAWNEGKNKTVSEVHISTFSSTPNDGKTMPAKTRFLAPKSKDGILYAEKPAKITDIPDGTSNTLFFVQVNEDQAKNWMEPDDWEPNAKDILKGVLDEKLGGFNASYSDGSVRFIKKEFGAKYLKALITRAGGEVVPFE